MPVYNGEGHLQDALNDLLGQTFDDLELIVVDNASTDRTAEIALGLAGTDSRIRYERNPQNIGAVGNFNRVLERAQGEYFMWAAHDDRWAPTYVERCLARFGADPELVLVGTAADLVDPITGHVIDRDEGFSTIGLPPLDRYREYKRKIHSGHHYGALYYGVHRRDALCLATPVPNMIAGDHIVLARLSFLGAFDTLPDTLVSKRWGGASASFARAAAAMGITDRRAIALPMLFRELALQRVVRTAPGLSKAERVRCSVWSWANYLSRHGLADLRSILYLWIPGYARLAHALGRRKD